MPSGSASRRESSFARPASRRRRRALSMSWCPIRPISGATPSRRLQREVREHDPRVALDGGRGWPCRLPGDPRSGRRAARSRAVLPHSRSGYDQARSVAALCRERRPWAMWTCVSDLAGIERVVTRQDAGAAGAGAAEKSAWKSRHDRASFACANQSEATELASLFRQQSFERSPKAGSLASPSHKRRLYLGIA